MNGKKKFFIKGFSIENFRRTDGILSTLMREGVAAENDDKRWYIFDGMCED